MKVRRVGYEKKGEARQKRLLFNEDESIRAFCRNRSGLIFCVPTSNLGPMWMMLIIPL